jgi:hypothetical protein
MKTFSEFTQPVAEKPSSSFPTFSEVKEGKGQSCMSEGMRKKMNEMYEAMCEEMSSCHTDESENTAESYMKECDMMMKEMMEGLSNHCNECMK